MGWHSGGANFASQTCRLKLLKTICFTFKNTLFNYGYKKSLKCVHMYTRAHTHKYMCVYVWKKF